jgi:hypothetical protein
MGVMFLRVYELADNFWSAKPCRYGYTSYGIRDEILVDDCRIRYLLWGNEIATWDMREHRLTICDCGYLTRLTKERLNNILERTDFEVYSCRGKWCIYSRRKNKSYIWIGRHFINLDDGSIKPAVPRTVNPKVSKALEKLYNRAMKFSEGFFNIPTLDGHLYLAVKNAKRMERKVLAVHVNNGEVEVKSGYVHILTIYSAVAKNNRNGLTKLVRTLDSANYKVSNLIAELKLMDVDSNLPEQLASVLAVTKLIEG